MGDRDLFYDEDVDYARRLQAAGVPCELHIEFGMYHAAEFLNPMTASMRAFRDQKVEALRRGLHA